MSKKKELTIFEYTKVIGFYETGDSERTILKKRAIQRQLSIMQLQTTAKQVLLLLLLKMDDLKK